MNPIKKVDQQSKVFIKNIRDFIKEYGILAIAVGVIFAQSAKDLIDALVKGLFLPLLGLILPVKNLTSLEIIIDGNKFNLGGVFNTFFSFLLVVIVLYIIVKRILKESKENKEEKK